MSTTQYLALLGLWVAGIVSPGPDILVILRNAFLSSRGKAMLTALGVMIGNIIWITLSLTGVTVVINQNEVLKLIIQIAGALFLAWLGFGSIRSALAAKATSRRRAETARASASGGVVPGAGETAPSPATVEAAEQIPEPASGARGGGILGTKNLTGFRAVVQGIITNLSNAKAIVFFIALFASVVPADALWWESMLVAVLLFVVGLVWFCAVAWFGSVPALAARFQAHSVGVELVAGVVFLAVSVLLLVEAALSW